MTGYVGPNVETLIVVFEAPNGIGSDPQTLVYKETMNTDGATAYQEEISLADEYQHHCGYFQIDAITEESANSEGGPTMWDQWNALNVGEVATGLTGTASNPHGLSGYESVGLGYEASCQEVPPPAMVPPPVTEEAPPPPPPVTAPAPVAPVAAVVEVAAPVAPSAPEVATGTTTTTTAPEAPTAPYSTTTEQPAPAGPTLAMTGASGQSIALLLLIAALFITAGIIAVRKTVGFIR